MDHGSSDAGGGRDVDAGQLGWRRVTESDFVMIAEWLTEPRVKRWWNHETTPEAVERDFGPTARGEEPAEDFIVTLDGRPVGLVQRSRIADYPEDQEDFARLADVPEGAATLDYLVASAADRDRGLGSRMIVWALERTWADLSDTPAVLVAVVAANVASWRALEKAGLVRVGEGEVEPDNPIDDPLHVVYRIDRP